MMGDNMMNEEKFWEYIDEGQVEGELYSYLFTTLNQLDQKEILEFHTSLTVQLAKACTFPLLAANFTIESYVSDDGFKSFRAWLISQGSAKYKAAIDDPETIADWLDKDSVDEIDGDDLLSVVQDVYEEKYGDDFLDLAVSEPEPDIDMDWPDNKREYRAKWPKLVDKFWDDDRIREMHD